MFLLWHSPCFHISMNRTSKKQNRKEMTMEKNVLLIDDEASLRRSVSIGLMQKGYHTEPCENGMKGLQTLEMFKKKSIPSSARWLISGFPTLTG